MHLAHLSYHTLVHNTKDSQSTKMVKVSNLIARNTSISLPKWTSGWSSSTWTKGQKKRNPAYLYLQKTSDLYEITPLKLHALQYHMYHQVHMKNESFLGKTCSMAQKVENFHQEMPGFNFGLQMTVSCSEIKLHGFVGMKILHSSKFFKSQRFKCKYSWTPQSIFSTPNPFWIFYHTNH